MANLQLFLWQQFLQQGTHQQQIREESIIFRFADFIVLIQMYLNL